MKTSEQIQVIADWINALESGKYKQTKEHLADSNGFCCLGVLCELAVKAKVIPKPITNNGIKAYESETLVLPEAVREWAGLKYVSPVAGSEFLSNLNDSGQNFKKIAKEIEKHYEEL